MRTFIQKILLKIADSAKMDTSTSSTRVTSYLILGPIIFMILIFLIIEIAAFIHALAKGIEYHLSNEIILIFGMMLSHHLAVLFSRTKSQSIGELKGTDTVIDEPVIKPTSVETTSTTVETTKAKFDDKKTSDDENYADQV